MAYSKTTWVDGTTPVNASNLNKIENGVSDCSGTVDDITDTGILTKKIVSESGSSVYLSSGLVQTNGATVSFSYNRSVILYVATSSNAWGVYFVVESQIMNLQSNSQFDVSADGSTITITNYNTGTQARYLIICG